MSRTLTTCVLLILTFQLIGQDYPQDYFKSPVNHPIRLSGSFAELRTNHFHMGIDIKSSKGVAGDPILAVADGFISRIVVDASGFGQAIYINHDNGYTSVYAHLHRFNDTITKYVRAYQHDKQTFGADMQLDSTQIIITQGDTIAQLGNKGNSFGPHLHFELRETESEIPVNPFLFGIKPSDQRPPVMQSLKVYSLNSKQNIISSQTRKAKAIRSGNYFFETDTIEVESNRGAFSLQAYDQMDGSYNKNGVYRMDVLVDGKLSHGYTMKKVPYSESHYINAHIDYEEKQKSKKQYTNCFRYPVDSLSVYHHKDSLMGVVHMVKGSVHEVEINLTDFHGNRSSAKFYMKMKGFLKLTSDGLHNYTLAQHQRNIISLESAVITFPEKAFRTETELRISEYSEQVNGKIIKTYNIGKRDVPLFKSYQLYLDSIPVADFLKKKMCLIQCQGETTTAYKGNWDNNQYQVSLASLGEFQIGYDTIAPKIEPLQKKINPNKSSRIAFKITDNFEPSNKNSRLSYDAYLDGEWILMEYDLKNDLIYHILDKNLQPGEHKFELNVSDAFSNQTNFRQQF